MPRARHRPVRGDPDDPPHPFTELASLADAWRAVSGDLLRTIRVVH